MKLAREKHGSPAAAADAVTAAVADTVVAARVASEEDTNGPQLTFLAGHWAGLDSNQRRRKASRFTVCPVWPLRYLPFPVSGTLATAKTAHGNANCRSLFEKFNDGVYHIGLHFTRNPAFLPCY